MKKLQPHFLYFSLFVIASGLYLSGFDSIKTKDPLVIQPEGILLSPTFPAPVKAALPKPVEVSPELIGMFFSPPKHIEETSPTIIPAAQPESDSNLEVIPPAEPISNLIPVETTVSSIPVESTMNLNPVESTASLIPIESTTSSIPVNIEKPSSDIPKIDYIAEDSQENQETPDSFPPKSPEATQSDLAVDTSAVIAPTQNSSNQSDPSPTTPTRTITPTPLPDSPPLDSGNPANNLLVPNENRTLQTPIQNDFNPQESPKELDNRSKPTPSHFIEQIPPLQNPPEIATRQLPKTLLINFNNVNIIEYIRFISKISNRNFVFDENELQFNVTIVSEEPTTLDNILAALVQELRIHGMTLIEQGNNFIIHKTPGVNSISRVVDAFSFPNPKEIEIVTRLFQLDTADPDKVAAVIRPLVSQQALVEVLKDSHHIIVTDISTNVNQIANLIKSLDSPNNKVVVGQYVVKRGTIDNLISLAQKIMLPISTDQTLIFVPHPSAKSIFIVSSPFIVERTISILQYLDQSQGVTRIFNLDDLKFSHAEAALGEGKAALAPPQRLVPSEWQVDKQGNWYYRPLLSPGAQYDPSKPPPGYWTIDEYGNWHYRITTDLPPSPGQAGFSGISLPDLPAEYVLPSGQKAPAGQWTLDSTGAWVFVINAGETTAPGKPPEAAGTTRGSPEWQLDQNGNWTFRPLLPPGTSSDRAKPPQGYWTVDEQGNWHFRITNEAPPTPLGGGIGGGTQPTGPEGQWILNNQGAWVFQLAPGKAISPERLIRPLRSSELPVGHIERTQFFIYKLKYRKGDQVQIALTKIALGMQQLPESTNEDLVAAINSVQWIESSNSLVFSGTVDALEKVKALILEVDTPLHQVFIEMLILNTTLTDSLQYSVNWDARFKNGNTSSAEGFLSPGSGLNRAISNNNVGSLVTPPGFSLGIIGQQLTHAGTVFGSIGALVKALHNKLKQDIILNPKIITEDNYPAEVFVGLNLPFQTQSVVNDLGVIVTQNFEYRDVGTRLKVTPQIGDNNIITLLIEEEVSAVVAPPSNVNQNAVNNGITTSKSRTVTRVHMPNKCFLVMSGVIEDDITHNRLQVPCLGAIPVFGALFSDQLDETLKRNQMIFIRPEIVDTEEDMERITKHQQDVVINTDKTKNMWRLEMEGAMDFLNLRGICEDSCPEGCDD